MNSDLMGLNLIKFCGVTMPSYNTGQILASGARVLDDGHVALGREAGCGPTESFNMGYRYLRPKGGPSAPSPTSASRPDRVRHMLIHRHLATGAPPRGPQG